jgi:hypothetical protein
VSVKGPFAVSCKIGFFLDKYYPNIGFARNILVNVCHVGFDKAHETLYRIPGNVHLGPMWSILFNWTIWLRIKTVKQSYEKKVTLNIAKAWLTVFDIHAQKSFHEVESSKLHYESIWNRNYPTTRSEISDVELKTLPNVSTAVYRETDRYDLHKRCTFFFSPNRAD